MNEQNIQRRLVRRERFRSRSRASIVALSLVALGLAYVGVECALAALSHGPLLVAPEQLIAGIDDPSTYVVVGAGVAVLFGLVLVVLAVSPGRRARHALPHDRMGIVVDDDVLAGSLGRAARGAASVAAGRVRTTVSARRATIAVTPSSGFPVDRAAVETASREVAASLAPVPRITVGVAVSASGVVGS